MNRYFFIATLTFAARAVMRCAALTKQKARLRKHVMRGTRKQNAESEPRASKLEAPQTKLSRYHDSREQR